MYTLVFTELFFFFRNFSYISFFNHDTFFSLPLLLFIYFQNYSEALTIYFTPFRCPTEELRFDFFSFPRTKFFSPSYETYVIVSRSGDNGRKIDRFKKKRWSDKWRRKKETPFPLGRRGDSSFFCCFFLRFIPYGTDVPHLRASYRMPRLCQDDVPASIPFHSYIQDRTVRSRVLPFLFSSSQGVFFSISSFSLSRGFFISIGAVLTYSRLDLHPYEEFLMFQRERVITISAPEDNRNLITTSFSRQIRLKS